MLTQIVVIWEDNTIVLRVLLSQNELMKAWFESWFNGFHGDTPLCYGVAYFLCTHWDTVEDDDRCSQSCTTNISIKWVHCNYRTLCICFNFKLDEPSPCFPQEMFASSTHNKSEGA